MPLSIVRNDITKMNVDAIVNSTNEFLNPGGFGVDASIHAAAGPELLQALSKIQYCPVGSAVITGAYNISQCSYIIHAVGPRYKDGKSGEQELLKECYRKIISLAIKNSCASVAIPTISSGHHRFPAREAYTIATHTIRDTLEELDADLDVFLVIFSNKMFNASENENDAVKEYITDYYREQNEEYLVGINPYARRRGRRDTALSNCSDVSAAESRIDNQCPQMPMCREEAVETDEKYSEQSLPFAEMCEWWCKKKNIAKGTFYRQANINKAVFWNLKHNKEQVPKKTTAFACAIGLELSLEEAGDLLMRAGIILSGYYTLDTMVSDYITRRNYDIDEINLKLFEKDMPLLGCY